MLRFQDAKVEAEFAKELRDKRRRGTLLVMVVAALAYIFNFIMSDGSNQIYHSQISSRIVSFGNLAVTSLIFALAAATWVCKLDVEVATLLFIIVVDVSLFTGNTFRVSQVFGGDLYEQYVANCDSAICYDDTVLVVTLVGVTSATIIFAALRVAKSWMLVIFSTLFYFLASSFGLGPLRHCVRLGGGIAGERWQAHG